MSSFISLQKHSTTPDIPRTTEKAHDKPKRESRGRARCSSSGSSIKTEDADTHQTPPFIVYIFKSLILGLPSKLSPIYDYSALAINFLISLMVLDLVYRSPIFYPSHDLSLARLGFVDETSARVVIREPRSAELPIYFSFREDSHWRNEREGRAKPMVADSPKSMSAQRERYGPWHSVDKIYYLGNETDYTTTVVIEGLKTGHRYEYSATNGRKGRFKTAPKLGNKHIQIGNNNNNNNAIDTFSFLTSSCLKPRFPYNLIHHPLHMPGFTHLAKNLPFLNPSFMLFLGDFIYVDVPRRFGFDVETYRREYRQVYAGPEWKSVSSLSSSLGDDMDMDDLPWIHVIDDHEIANDWDQNTTTPYPAAIDPWWNYQGLANPPPPSSSNPKGKVSTGQEERTSYFQFSQGLASFFLMDTRRYRSPEFEFANSPNSTWASEKTMLGTQQKQDLLAFLKKPEPAGVKWKIVVSSIPFTRNWRVNSQDTWAGYLSERQVLLEAMWDVGSRGDGTGVIVLSGDRHEFAATAFPPPRNNTRWPATATVHEFSTSPLSMFYLPIRTYREVEGEDEVCIKYVPDGNSKFGAVEIQNLKGGDQSTFKFRLFVDGKETWSYVVTTPEAGTVGGRAQEAIWG